MNRVKDHTPRDLQLDAGGRRLRVRDWGGEGPPLLLLHGMGGNAHWWDPVAPALAARHRVFALDFRGHGDSSWSDPPAYQLEDYAADLEGARAALSLGKIRVAAHSLGARVALRHAALYPDAVERLAALDFLAEFWGNNKERHERRRRRRQPSFSDPEAMARRFHLEPDKTTLSAEALAALGRTSIRPAEGGRWTWKFDWRAFDIDYPPVWPLLSAVKAPCLVVRGEHSTVMPRGEMERSVRELPQAQGVEIAGAYHHVTLDAPARTADALLKFFP